MCTASPAQPSFCICKLPAICHMKSTMGARETSFNNPQLKETLHPLRLIKNQRANGARCQSGSKFCTFLLHLQQQICLNICFAEAASDSNSKLLLPSPSLLAPPLLEGEHPLTARNISTEGDKVRSIDLRYHCRRHLLFVSLYR